MIQKLGFPGKILLERNFWEDPPYGCCWNSHVCCHCSMVLTPESTCLPAGAFCGSSGSGSPLGYVFWSSSMPEIIVVCHWALLCPWTQAPFQRKPEVLKGELVQISHKDISVVCRDVQIVFQCNIKTEDQETMGEQRLGAEIPSLGKSSDHCTVFLAFTLRAEYVCNLEGRDVLSKLFLAWLITLTLVLILKTTCLKNYCVPILQFPHVILQSLLWLD